jgi:hypothetical protein
VGCATFASPASSGITVEHYTVIFFAASGQETGSGGSQSSFIVAAGNSYADQEDNPMLDASVPSGSASCRVSGVQNA